MDVKLDWVWEFSSYFVFIFWFPPFSTILPIPTFIERTPNKPKIKGQIRRTTEWLFGGDSSTCAVSALTCFLCALVFCLPIFPQLDWSNVGHPDARNGSGSAQSSWAPFLWKQEVEAMKFGGSDRDTLTSLGLIQPSSFSPLRPRLSSAFAFPLVMNGSFLAMWGSAASAYGYIFCRCCVEKIWPYTCRSGTPECVSASVLERESGQWLGTFVSVGIKKKHKCWILVRVCFLCDRWHRAALCRSGRKQDVRKATLCRTKSNSDTAAVSFLSMWRSCSTAAALGATPPTALLICSESISRVISIEMNVGEVQAVLVPSPEVCSTVKIPAPATSKALTPRCVLISQSYGCM